MSCMSNNSQKDPIVLIHGPWLKQVPVKTYKDKYQTNIQNPSKSFDHQTTCLTNTNFQHPSLDLGLSYNYCVYYSALTGHTHTKGYHKETTQDKRKNLSQIQSHSSLMILTDVISHFQNKKKRGNIRTCSLTITTLQTRILSPQTWGKQTINWAQHAQHTTPIPMSYKHQLNRSWKQNTSTIHHCTAFPNQAHLYSDFRLNQDKRNTRVTHQISRAESNLASPKNGSKAPTLRYPFIPHKHESISVQHMIPTPDILPNIQIRTKHSKETFSHTMRT